MPSRNPCLSGYRRFSIYAEAVCPPDEVYYSGSEDEHYDAPATRRRRYEDAGQNFLSGRVPLLISSSLRGPFEKESGWLNPWRSRRPEVRCTEHSVAQAPKASLVSNVIAQTDHDLSNASLECHLPSPESLKQDMIDETHHFLRDETLARVRSWQAQVDVPSLSQDSFWASSKISMKDSTKKRRAKESSWLKKLNHKKQKTDWSDPLSFSSPLARKQLSQVSSADLLREGISRSLSLSPQTAGRQRDKGQDEDELLGSTRQCSLQSAPAQISLTTRRVSPMRKIRKRAILGSDEAEDELAHLGGPEATLSSPVSQKMENESSIAANAAVPRQDQRQQETNINDVQMEGHSSSKSEIIGPQEVAVHAYETLNKKSVCLEEQGQPLMCDKSSSASTLSELGASPSLPTSARSSTESKPDELEQQCTSVIGLHDSRKLDIDELETSMDLSTQSLHQNETPSTMDVYEDGESSKSLKPEQQVLAPVCPLSDSAKKQTAPRPACPIIEARGHTGTSDQLSDGDGVSSHVSVCCEAQPQVQGQPSQKEPGTLLQSLVSPNPPNPQVHLCEPAAAWSSHSVVKAESDVDGYRACNSGDKSADDVGSTSSCCTEMDQSATDLPCTPSNGTHRSVLSAVNTGHGQASQDVAACLTQVDLQDQLHDAAISASQQTPWAKTQMSQLCLISKAASPGEHLQQAPSEAPTTPRAVSLEAQSPWPTNGVGSAKLDIKGAAEAVYAGEDAGCQQANVCKPRHQRLLTPEPLFSVTPFSAFLSASPWDRKRRANDRRSLPSSMKNASRQPRAKHGVSWAPLPEQDAAPGQHHSPNMACGSLTRQGSPPPPVGIKELPMSHKSKFSKHFVAVAGRSTGHALQKLIPTASQQAQLSPGLQAMAETFMAADDCRGGKRTRLDTRTNGASHVKGTLNDQVEAGDGQDQEPLDIAEDVFREMQDFWQS